MKEEIRKKILEAGASAVGFAKSGAPSSQVIQNFEKWIENEMHGDMAYLQRHIPLRSHTDNVLPGSKTIISIAFSYVPLKYREENLPAIACYAYGEDYHDVIRKKLNPLINKFKEIYGGEWRICIDSAPVEERYWAVKSGIAKRGINGNVIVEACGSLCFLAEILTTLEIDPDREKSGKCIGCGKCIEICPAGAITGDGTIDARLCINYISIEKKGELSEDEKFLMRKGKGTLYGCDRCLLICPHNQSVLPSSINEFKAKEFIIDFTLEKALLISEEEFNEKFKKSSLKRAGYAGIKRNAEAIKKL